MIACEDRLWHDQDYVDWVVKLYSNSISADTVKPCYYSVLKCHNFVCKLIICSCSFHDFIVLVVGICWYAGTERYQYEHYGFYSIICSYFIFGTELIYVHHRCVSQLFPGMLSSVVLKDEFTVHHPGLVIQDLVLEPGILVIMWLVLLIDGLTVWPMEAYTCTILFDDIDEIWN